MKRITWRTIYALSTYPGLGEIIGMKDGARREALGRLIEHTATRDNGRPMDGGQAWEAVIHWSETCTFVGHALEIFLAVTASDRAKVFARVAGWMRDQGWDGEAEATPWAVEKIFARRPAAECEKMAGRLTAADNVAWVSAICQLERIPLPKKGYWRNFGFRAFAACAQARM